MNHYIKAVCFQISLVSLIDWLVVSCLTCVKWRVCELVVMRKKKKKSSRGRTCDHILTLTQSQSLHDVSGEKLISN